MANGDTRTEGVPRRPSGGVEKGLPDCLDGNGGGGGGEDVENGVRSIDLGG